MSKFIRLFLTVILCIPMSITIHAQDVPKKKVAVYISGNDTDESIKKVFGSKIVSAIAKSNGYAAVERTADFLKALRDETDYQTSGEVRDSQIASLGQKFGVRFVVVADVTEVFDEYFISSRLINVETGLVERSDDVNGAAETMSELVVLADKIADAMILKPEREKLQEEKEKKKKIEEEKRLQQERVRQEIATKERHQREEQERLRQTAINNLRNRLGYKNYIIGDIIMMDDLIQVSFKYDESSQRVVSTNSAPAGWQMADCDVFRAVTQYGRYNRDVPGVYWVVCPVRAFPVRNGSFKDGKQLGSWSICCFDLNMNVLENKIIGQTIKQTGLKNPVFNRNSYSFYTLFYRPMFSEAEIQAEINRIKYNI